MENTNCYRCNSVTSSILDHMHPSTSPFAFNQILLSPPSILDPFFSLILSTPPLSLRPTNLLLAPPLSPPFISQVNNRCLQSRLSFVSFLFIFRGCFPLLPPSALLSSLSSLHLHLVTSSFCLSTLPTRSYTILRTLLCLRRGGKTHFCLIFCELRPMPQKCEEELGLFRSVTFTEMSFDTPSAYDAAGGPCWRQEKRLSGTTPPTTLSLSQSVQNEGKNSHWCKLQCKFFLWWR